MMQRVLDQSILPPLTPRTDSSFSLQSKIFSVYKYYRVHTKKINYELLKKATQLLKKVELWKYKPIYEGMVKSYLNLGT